MKLSVVIQAGGNSQRMGQDKALVPFLGEPLIQRVVKRLAGFGDETIVTTNHPEAMAFLGLPCILDQEPGRGALGGLGTALAAAQFPMVAVVACDMPFANPELLRLACDRLGEAEAVIPRSPGGREPLHAVYRREACLPAVRSALNEGLWRVDSWLPLVRVLTLEPAEYAGVDPHGLTFMNVNTPEELEAAERIARGQTEW
jgi:molybdopterin-guanine dinucleotide biosynthesis protein A